MRHGNANKHIEEVEGLPDYVSQEEYKFIEAFRKLVEEHQVPTVGGIMFESIGSPYGYCYNGRSMMVAWDSIMLDGRLDEKAQREYEKTGTECYKLAVYSANERGLAVTGAYFEQNEIGFLYSPLDSDLDEKKGRKIGVPKKYHPISHEEFNEEIQKYAARLEKNLGLGG